MLRVFVFSLCLGLLPLAGPSLAAPRAVRARAASAAPGSATPDAEIKARAEALAPATVAVRRDLHVHPELSNREERTGRLIADRLRALGLEVRYPVARTGAVGILRGGRPGRVVALRADIDALAMPDGKDVGYRSRVEGVAHACGHDVHTVFVLGAARALARLGMEESGRAGIAGIAGTVRLVFEPAEESVPGGAVDVLAEGHLEGVAAIFGLHCDPKIDLAWVVQSWPEDTSLRTGPTSG